jgi:hypothetical protein
MASRVNKAMAAIQGVALAATVGDREEAQQKLEASMKELDEGEREAMAVGDDPTAEEWMEFGRKVVSAVRMGMKIYKAFAP